MDALPFSTVAIVLGIILFATLVRAIFGFGDALIGMPLITMVVGLKSATPLVALVAVTIGRAILASNWRAVHLAGAWRLVLSTIVGIPIGLYFLKGSYEIPMQLVLGSVILLFALYSLRKSSGLELHDERYSYAFGLAAGILGGAYNTNGPAVVMYGTMRRWNPARFRATLQGYFVVTGLIILLGHGAAGLWTPMVLKLYLAALPAVCLSSRSMRMPERCRGDLLQSCLKAR